MNKRRNLKTSLLNFLGGAGYIVALLQWFWAIAIFLPSIVALPFVKEFLGHSETETVRPTVVTQAAASSGPGPVISFLGFVLAFAVVLGIVYVLVTKIPRSIAKSGEAITHKPAAIIAPIVVKHVHLSPKEKKALPTWLIVIFKLLIVYVPLCLLVFASTLKLAISFEIIMVIGALLFSWSFFVFALQLLLARLWRVDYKTVR